MILTLTMSPAVDVFATTDTFYNDSKTRCQIQTMSPGGGGINVARNLRRMGLGVMAVFPAGGFHGQQLRQLLADDGLPSCPVNIAAETTQNISLIELSTGKNLHLVFPGAALTADELSDVTKELDSVIPRPDCLVISGSLPPSVPDDFFASVIGWAKQNGIKVVIDTSGPALLKALQAGVTLVKLNREDFTALGYQGADTPEARIVELKAMADRGLAEHMVLTLGPNGALLANRAGELWHVRPPQVTVVSHAGAGDSFVSVMTARLQQGFAVPDAFAYGVAAAAAAISTPGNQLEDLALLERLYKGVERRRLG